MKNDSERLAALEAAFEAARTGLYENAAEVTEAISLSEAGIWDNGLVDQSVTRQLDKICAKYFKRPAEAGVSDKTVP